MAESESRYQVLLFVFFGAALFVAGVGWWFQDRATLDLWLAGVGLLIVGLGGAWWYAFNRVFVTPPSSGPPTG